MALYEVMSKARIKPSYGQTLEKLRAEAQAQEPEADAEQAAAGQADARLAEPASAETTRAVEVAKGGVRWRRKPRVVQFNAGRIEFSLPYQLAIAMMLGLVVLVLVAFRAGELSAGVSELPAGGPAGPARTVGEIGPPAGTRPAQSPRTAGPQPTRTTDGAPAGRRGGDNVIVLVQHNSPVDLVPVQAHFAGYGIDTEIVKWDGKYFLITKDRYTSFGPGGDGYEAKKRIAEIGAKYKGKAPEGYEKFAPHYFSDAYGKKVE